MNMDRNLLLLAESDVHIAGRYGSSIPVVGEWLEGERRITPCPDLVRTRPAIHAALTAKIG